MKDETYRMALIRSALANPELCTSWEDVDAGGSTQCADAVLARMEGESQRTPEQDRRTNDNWAGLLGRAEEARKEVEDRLAEIARIASAKRTIGPSSEWYLEIGELFQMLDRILAIATGQETAKSNPVTDMPEVMSPDEIPLYNKEARDA